VELPEVFDPDGLLQHPERVWGPSLSRAIVHHDHARAQRLHERWRPGLLEAMVRGQVQLPFGDDDQSLHCLTELLECH